MKEQFAIYIETDLNGELEIWLEAKISTWEEEKPETGEDALYPGCDAGSSIDELYVLRQPDLESVTAIINDLGGIAEEFIQHDVSGITLILDRNKGVVVDSFNEDEVHDLIVGL